MSSIGSPLLSLTTFAIFRLSNRSFGWAIRGFVVLGYTSGGLAYAFSFSAASHRLTWLYMPRKLLQDGCKGTSWGEGPLPESLSTIQRVHSPKQYLTRLPMSSPQLDSNVRSWRTRLSFESRSGFAPTGTLQQKCFIASGQAEERLSA